MDLNSSTNLMEFAVNEGSESEQMMGYEETTEYENIDTMGIETEIVDPFQEDFERGDVTDPMEFPQSERSPNGQIISFDSNTDHSAIDPMPADPELVDSYQESYINESGASDSILEFPNGENIASDQMMNFGTNQTLNSSYIPAEFTVPYQTKVDHEIIAISDDEEEDEKMRQPQYLVKPSQRPLYPVFRQQRIPVPMVPMVPVQNIANDSEVITLSDDDDAARPFRQGIKRKKSSRRRATMFHPQTCPFCRKQSRDNICMARHLIKHHWQRIRIHNSGGKKGTDYFNLKDDREIPAERQERYEEERPRFTPLPPSLPPRIPPPNSFRQRDDMVIGQPLKPTFMQGMQPPYRGFPGNPDNVNMFNEAGGFSHHPSANMAKPNTTPAGDSENNIESRNDAADDLGHPDNRKIVQQQLGLLMHAHKCDGKKPNRKQNSFFQEESKDCALPECKDTKELLKHLPGCVAGTDCPVPKCFMAKQIIKWALSGQSPSVLTEMRSELNRQAKAGLPQDILQWALKQPFDKEQWKAWREKKLTKSSVPNIQGQPQSTLPTTLLSMNNVFPPNKPVSTNQPNTGQPNAGQPNVSLSNVVLPKVGNPNRGNPPKPPLSMNNLGKMPTLQRKPMIAEMQKEATKPETQTSTQPQPLESKPISDWKKKYIEAAEKRRGIQTARTPSTPQPKTDKVIPSKAPADLLSGLLSSQNATAELRKVRKPEPIIDKRYQNVNKKRPTPAVNPKPNPTPSAPLQATTSGQEAAMYNSMLSL